MVTASATTVTGKGHRDIAAGSRKEKIALAYDRGGADAALKKGDELKLKSATIKSWISAWKKKKPAKSARGRQKSAA